jgi:hypothetical protein
MTRAERSQPEKLPSSQVSLGRWARPSTCLVASVPSFLTAAVLLKYSTSPVEQGLLAGVRCLLASWSVGAAPYSIRGLQGYNFRSTNFIMSISKSWRFLWGGVFSGVFIWLTRLFTRRSKAPLLPEPAPPVESPPPWVAPLLDSVQKSSRAQARLALHVEDLERKLEGGLAELRGSLSALRGRAAGDSPGVGPRWDELLDALDLLGEATLLADGALASGLAGVAARLERFLAQAGLSRLAPLGQPPDGRLFRIVGTQPHPSLVEGAVVRVVRAAVLRGEHLVREGQVIIVRNSP